ncbi:MAG: hypothetical protein EOO81_11055, partial [Oxalobacteraceae bacterium]
MSTSAGISQTPPAMKYGRYRRFLIGASFCAVMLQTIAATWWKVAGMPLQAFLSASLFIVIAIAHRDELARAFRRHAHLINLTVAVAFIGILTSIQSHVPAGYLINEVIEIHVQSVIILMFGALVAEICGAKTVLMSILAAILLSALFAIAQFFHLDAPW